MKIEFQIAGEGNAERLIPLMREYTEGEGERFDSPNSGVTSG
ncbi:MAG: hypothetical protein V3U83_03305 [Acidobacteriota bacterium]